MSAVIESQELTDLYARAGASDKDRTAWLAERAQGITATEIRDLIRGKIRQQDLIDLKLGRKTDSFTGNVYTDWGNLREPVIAEGVRGYGIEPESRVFHGVQNSRHLASPDGLGVQFGDALVVSEIKTAGKDIRHGTTRYEETGYELQMQWAMWVTGATRCLFVFEERISTRAGFEPGQLFSEWVERDEAMIAALIARADLFLAELDRQREDGAPVIDEDVDTHAVNYLRAIDEEKRWAALKQEHYAAVVAAGISQESSLARVTYTPAVDGEVVEVEEIDYDAARADGAALFAQLQKVQARWDAHLRSYITTKPVQGKGRPAKATITAGKGMKK
ncbi:YqaJ viral recombinase family protein [Microbacterium sp. MYb64]|uniref:YqaJ viral recombinase family protein n=1 Tax=Microbacterium sp. MYb64 TaxID=1848691 RepID=UPI000CFDC5B2|nr:YqaJ viral recombinase family protein [Microbacterium sp. MYb64]PRB01789.1 hypothetical protein CQ044_16715 [Microbacterium sp. MYb64]